MQELQKFSIDENTIHFVYTLWEANLIPTVFEWLILYIFVCICAVSWFIYFIINLLIVLTSKYIYSFSKGVKYTKSTTGVF